ncbi:MAG TPA: ABC transporter ATP-binding protein [Gaiellaceae bacterium]|nr:ABC transporter ATP-binding protein [Gaiellaceae bacterium]
MREFSRGFRAILRSGWRASPGRMVIVLVLMLLEYVSWPLAPLVLKEVTDAVVARDLRAATVAAAFLPLLALLNQVAGHIAHVVWVELSDLNLIEVNRELGELSHGPHGLEHHERPEYADRLELMRNEGNPMYRSISIAVRAAGLVIQLLLTVVMLTLLEPLLLLLLLFAVPPLLTARWADRRFEAAVWGDVERSRKATHLLDLAVRADAAKEIRIFGLEEELRRRLRTTREDLRSRRFRAEYEGVAVMAAGQLVFALGYVGGLLLVVRGAVAGDHTPGDVVLAVTLAAQTNNLVYSIVFSTRFLQRSVRAMGRLAWLRGLIAWLYPPAAEEASVPARLREGIRFEAVGFRYPGTEADVLADLDLHVPAGTTIAFVGENGAGKSTLVKLLCRFYDPTTGRVLVDGHDLTSFRPAEWHARIAAGFQDFVRFELVARESVGVGDLRLVDDRAAVTAAVERAAADDLLAQLSDGLETQLGKTHADGAELSGGQWQKIALARAMMRTQPLLLILDEPTSALDAHAEHLLFERYAQSARAVARATGGIAVFVSHRFSTVRMADLIVVVEGGRIAEQGSHEELVASNGIYAELFALQAAAYG